MTGSSRKTASTARRSKAELAQVSAGEQSTGCVSSSSAALGWLIRRPLSPVPRVPAVPRGQEGRRGRVVVDARPVSAELPIASHALAGLLDVLVLKAQRLGDRERLGWAALAHVNEHSPPGDAAPELLRRLPRRRGSARDPGCRLHLDSECPSRLRSQPPVRAWPATHRRRARQPRAHGPDRTQVRSPATRRTSSRRRRVRTPYRRPVPPAAHPPAARRSAAGTSPSRGVCAS
jgi:hypothetical protein